MAATGDFGDYGDNPMKHGPRRGVCFLSDAERGIPEQVSKQLDDSSQ